ncbi:uncharacterized protein LAJ45_07570 [Morchella importuna]|uniref:uncharacterized protein n=1 Tax=Morchella importuna TaxID=1174673 RepID=UPI001E8E41B0|nr:uncharacterized protein LAJ45_07570 [Morchella importuna]KAH8148467.1 hypothetical protein LAJ45_07570 [Morchella importuna]
MDAKFDKMDAKMDKKYDKMDGKIDQAGPRYPKEAVETRRLLWHGTRTALCRLAFFHEEGAPPPSGGRDEVPSTSPLHRRRENSELLGGQSDNTITRKPRGTTRTDSDECPIWYQGW